MKGDLVELSITNLSHTGSGVGRVDDQVIFVPDTVPGDRLKVKIIEQKKRFSLGRIEEILAPSPERVRPACIVADKCGGCQWQVVSAAQQAQSKQQLIIDALERIGGFTDLPLQPFLSSPQPLGYRSKVCYPLARSKTGQVQAGYYRRNSHKLINLNQCPIQDSRLNPLLAGIKVDIQQQGWSIYNEQEQRGKLRHLCLRLGQQTGEILITLVSTQANLTNIEAQAAAWLTTYPEVVGVCLNIQPQPGNRIFGSETHCLAGQATCREHFAGLTFHLAAETFFQINTPAAEQLLSCLTTALALRGDELLVDAYAGIGTFSLPLAQQVRQAIAIESNPASVQQGEMNLRENQIQTIQFVQGAVEAMLPTLPESIDVLLLDPPRKGCTTPVLTEILRRRPPTIAYVGCQPASLARDLQRLCQEGGYRVTWVQGCDFFPQTAHVECAVILRRQIPEEA